MIKLVMISLFRYNIRKDIEYKHELKTERWMKTEYGDRLEDYHELQTGGFIVKLKTMRQ